MGPGLIRSLRLPALGALAVGLHAQSLSPAAFFQLAQQSRTAYSIQGDGARAMGTGGAFLAVADDATAVSCNPAGLAQLLKPEASLGLQALSRTQTFTGAVGTGTGSGTTFQDTFNKDRHAHPSFASFTFPWKQDGLNHTLLVSYQRLFDLDFDSSTRYLAKAAGGSTIQAISQDIRQSGSIDLYALGYGVEVSPRILLGLSLNSWRGRWGFSALSSRRTSGISETFDSDLSQDSTFRGTSWNAGFIWRSDWVNVGALYRSGFTATYTYADRYSHIDTTTGVLITQASPTTPTAVQWPDTLGWGFALHLGPQVQLTTDWTLTDWSRTRYLGGALDGRNWFDYQQDTSIPEVRSTRAGLEWIAFASDRLVLPLRLGVFRDPQPIVDALTGEQRILRGWTLGLGMKVKGLTADLAYRDARAQRRASRFNTDAPVGGVAATALGNERLNERRTYLSLIYQFEGEGLRRALAWLLVGR